MTKNKNATAPTLTLTCPVCSTGCVCLTTVVTNAYSSHGTIPGLSCCHCGQAFYC